MALDGCDLVAVVVVGEGRKHEEAAFHACGELLATWARQWAKSVFHDDDGRQAGIEGGAHDALLARGDGWRDEYRSRASLAEAVFYLPLDLFLATAARDANLQTSRGGDQAAVADTTARVWANLQSKEGTEQVGAGALC